MTGSIGANAAVRHKKTGKLGRTFRNSGGNIRGHVFVQWDGERDRQTTSIHDVTLVSTDYNAAKEWEAMENGRASGGV